MEDFRVTYDQQSEKPFDETVVESITAFTPYRDNFVDLLFFVAHYMDNDESYDRVFAFLETILPYKSRSEKMTSWREGQFDNYRFILYELFLYLVAAFIKTKKYTVAARFIEGEYHHTETVEGSRYTQEGASAFNNYVSVLDDARKQRLRLNAYSVTGNLIVERATHQKVNFMDLYQADILLFIRAHFPEPGGCRRWYPQCVSHGWQFEALEVFARATSKAGFKGAQQLLKVKDLADLYSKLQAMFRDQGLMRLMSSERFYRIHWDRLLNLEKIKQALAPRE